jgi:hypothetical protein
MLVFRQRGKCCNRTRYTKLKYSIYLQLYVIQGKYRGRTIALGFALMKRRRRNCYRHLFRALANHYQALTGAALAPRLVVTDFEVTFLLIR